MKAVAHNTLSDAQQQAKAYWLAGLRADDIFTLVKRNHPYLNHTQVAAWVRAWAQEVNNHVA